MFTINMRKAICGEITRYKGLDKIIKLQSLDIEISMEELYHRTKITPPE